MISIVIMLLVIGVSVIFHEMGHFIMGKILNYGISEFCIGFGPMLFGIESRHGIQYKIRLIPLGGFVSFENKEGFRDINEFSWKKNLVILMGAVNNFLLAMVFMSCAICIMANNQVNIFQVIDISFAVITGYIGDLFKGFLKLFEHSAEVSVSASSAVALATDSYTAYNTMNISKAFLLYLFCSGGIINIYLMLFNLLPIPALDGGKLLVNIIEIIRKKALPFKLIRILELASFSAIMVFSVGVLIKDIVKLF